MTSIHSAEQCHQSPQNKYFIKEIMLQFSWKEKYFHVPCYFLTLNPNLQQKYENIMLIKDSLPYTFTYIGICMYM